MKSKKSYIKSAVYILLIAVIIIQTSCKKNSAVQTAKQEKSLFAMDTYITLTTYGEDTDIALTAAEEKIKSLEKLWSVTDKNSEVYKINNSGGKPVEVSPETAELIDFSLKMHKKTYGALDISLYPVLKEWGFTTSEYNVPNDEKISDLLKNTGVNKININKNSVQIPDQMQIDLGAIGKGYAGDLITETLKSYGIGSALINLGGNIQTVGTKFGGEKWKVGIRNPFGEGDFATLKIGECAVVTSGGYERYFEKDGKTYCHILNPKTGKPADSGLASVTVIGSQGKICDALSTALFVMGLDKAEQLWRNSNDFEMIIVTTNGNIYITEGIENDFETNDVLIDKKASVIRK